VTEIDRSVALSALLTTVCRGAMSVAPLHAFRANTAGTGKSYLCDLASALATGRPCPVVAAGSNGDETDKRLVGLLLAGFPLVSIDNLNGELGSDLLCQAVERPLIRLRRLGGSDISELEIRATLFANGNALRVRGDMTRRTVVCDLDAQEERPELRTFAFDPVERVLADRGRYVAAALTIVRAFVISDAKPDLAPLASYADYSATVRGALVWLGRSDPVLSMEGAREDDPELSELLDVMAQWQQHIGLNTDSPAKAIIHLADLHKHDDETGRQLPDYANPDLRDTLLAVAHGRIGIDAGRFGKWLRSKKGRVVSLQLPHDQRARVRFEARGLTQGVARWRLTSLSAKGGS
jgi:putative DNA primase/helicase